LPGQAPITGASFTVTLNEHVFVVHEFVAEQFTCVVPTAKVLPDAGVQVTDGAGEPVVVGVKLTTGLQVVISAGQVIAGLILIVTLNEQEEDPQLLEEVQVTFVVPVANVEPEAGLHVTVGVGVPVDVGFVQDTT
jgi:hypothetical protein